MFLLNRVFQPLRKLLWWIQAQQAPGYGRHQRVGREIAVSWQQGLAVFVMLAGQAWPTL